MTVERVQKTKQTLVFYLSLRRAQVILVWSIMTHTP